MACFGIEGTNQHRKFKPHWIYQRKKAPKDKTLAMLKKDWTHTDWIALLFDFPNVHVVNQHTRIVYGHTLTYICINTFMLFTLRLLSWNSVDWKCLKKSSPNLSLTQSVRPVPPVYLVNGVRVNSLKLPLFCMQYLGYCLFPLSFCQWEATTKKWKIRKNYCCHLVY